MMPSVAVVIPTRNRPDLLAEALESVARQSLQAAEVVVVDDASDGRAADALGGVREAHPAARFIRLPERRGGAVARNVGWRASTSELVAFLDDDDVWHPEKLERQVARLVAEGADFSWTGIEALRRTDGSTLGRQEFADVRYEDLLVRSELCCPTLLVRRGILEALGGFDESLSRNQDWDLYLRLFASYPGTYLKGAWTTVRWGRPDARACITGREDFYRKWSPEIARLPTRARRRARFTHHWLLWGNLAQLGDVRGEWTALRSMAPVGWLDPRLWRSLGLTLLHTMGWRGRHAGREAY